MMSFAPSQSAQSYQPKPLPQEIGLTESQRWVENPKLATVTYTAERGEPFQNKKGDTAPQLVFDLRLNRSDAISVADTFEMAVRIAHDKATSRGGAATAVLQARNGAFHVCALQGLGRDPKIGPRNEYPNIDGKVVSPNVAGVDQVVSPNVASVDLVSHESSLKAVIGKYQWIDLRGDDADFQPVAVPATA